MFSFLLCLCLLFIFFFFFFNDTATTEIYTLSLHDALPISRWPPSRCRDRAPGGAGPRRDRKSTRLNSSHDQISYAVFCLKKKKQQLTISVESLITCSFSTTRTTPTIT